MSIQNFLKKDNIETLWEVIVDADMFKFLSRDIQSNIYKLFFENIKGFFETERIKSTNLIDMNKKYIILILNYITKNYPSNIPNKIKIYEESDTKEAITYEEIQNEKKTQFEMDLMKRQQDFKNAISLEIPETPEFKDKFKDEPISEMDKMIKEITAKRNYDVEKINNYYQKDNDNWLKPQETSIKSEKFISEEFKKEDKNQSRIKYLNNNNFEKNKSVTWGENEEFQESEKVEFQEEDNIFKKLKKINTFENINEKNFEERLTNIEEKIEKYNDKLNKILQILEKK